jgi:uncharacterized protein (TIGR00369 family)
VIDAEHFRKLERMYAAAPVSRWYGSALAVLDGGRAEVTVPVREELFHAGRAVHGSAYFRALDDAAFFAVNSVVDDVLVVTVSFTTYFVRPVSSGVLRATGRLVHRSQRLYVAESSVMDAEGTQIGLGSGTFMRSATRLTAAVGYE